MFLFTLPVARLIEFELKDMAEPTVFIVDDDEAFRDSI